MEYSIYSTLYQIPPNFYLLVRRPFNTVRYHLVYDGAGEGTAVEASVGEQSRSRHPLKILIPGIQYQMEDQALWWTDIFV